MNDRVKTAALFAVADAYIKRGKTLQYDQLSMDRVAVVSARRQWFMPPEAATEQHYVFMDCSSWCFALFYQTFGYMLESCLTWHMIDVVKPRVFYHEYTHGESEEELSALRRKVRAVLSPGDVVVFQQESGFGHALLYVNEKYYLNCSQRGVFNGYDYKARRNVFTENGGIYREETRFLFEEPAAGDAEVLPDLALRALGRNCLFSPKVRRFAVLRPLELVGDPLPSALARLGDAEGLVCSVTSAYPEGKTCPLGEDPGYVLSVTNASNETRTAEIRMEGAGGRGGRGGPVERRVILPGESIQVPVPFEGAAAVAGDCIEDSKEDGILENTVYPYIVRRPKITVSGLPVWVPKVYVGRARSAGAAGMDGAADATGTAGVVGMDGAPAVFAGSTPAAFAGSSSAAFADFSGFAERQLHSLFSLHDGASGDVLVRVQEKEDDLAAPGLYGGYGVISPELSEGDERCSRVTYFSEAQLVPGDLIIAADDALCTKCYGGIYDGKCFRGATEFEGEEMELTGEELAVWLDSLPGRFVFTVLRP